MDRSPTEKQSVTESFALLWGPVAFAIGCLTTLGWMDNARGPIYPLLLEGLSLSHLQGSLFFAVASFVAVLANFMVPFLLSRMSSVMCLVLGMGFMIAFSILLSLSENLFVLLLAASSFGIALGVVMVAMNIVIDDFVEPARQRSMLSILHSFYGLAAFFAPILIGVILDWPLTWEQSFLPILFLSVPLLIYGVVLDRIFIKKHKHSLKRVAFTAENIHLPDAMKFKIVLYWSLILACYVSSELYLSSRITVLYHEALGFSLPAARTHLSYFFLGLFLGRVVNSFIPVKISGRRVLWMAFLLSVLGILFSLLYRPELICFVGFVMSPTYPVAVSEISNQCRGQFKKVLSLCVAWSSLAVVLMHMVSGWIADQWGLKASMYVPLMLMFIIFILVSFVWPSPKTSN